VSDEANIVEQVGDVDSREPALDRDPDDDGTRAVGFVPGWHAVAWVDPLPDLDQND